MKKKFFYVAMAACLAFGMTSCVGGVEDNTVPGDTTPGVSTIPSDDDAQPNPTLEDEANTTIPNLSYTVETEEGQTVIRIDLTGIQDPEEVNEWLRLYGTGLTNQNVWVEIDGAPKGFTVNNTIDESSSTTAPVDLVFLVDNSGSMSEEAEGLASQIQDWSAKLTSKFDIKFGVVGYGYYVGSQYDYMVTNYGIAGALNLTSKENLDDYLNARGQYGVARTFGYGGADADDLAAIASTEEFNKAGGECGVQALRFADEHFSFRDGANHVYVNFTDDLNYYGGREDISTDYVKDPFIWTSTKGTIHSVISETKENLENRHWCEYANLPWLMSDYTGGTIKFVPYNFSGVSLDDLPITGALQNSYYIRITNVEALFDGKPHVVKITILSPNGAIRAEREFIVVFEK